MAYLVRLTARAAHDLAALFERINAVDSIPAARWFNGLEGAIQALGSLPRRCPMAPERKRTGRPIRQLLYGKRPNVYRVLFEIDEFHKIVEVVTIRHRAMEEMGEFEL
jgi:plasmid stabilization system protein ParE